MKIQTQLRVADEKHAFRTKYRNLKETGFSGRTPAREKQTSYQHTLSSNQRITRETAVTHDAEKFHSLADLLLLSFYAPDTITSKYVKEDDRL